jgi:hypothetical protein
VLPGGTTAPNQAASSLWIRRAFLKTTTQGCFLMMLGTDGFRFAPESLEFIREDLVDYTDAVWRAIM